MFVIPDLAPKKVADLSVEEMAWLSMAESILPKLNLAIACQRCLLAGSKTGAVLQGANHPGDTVLSVTCDCRRLQYRAKA